MTLAQISLVTVCHVMSLYLVIKRVLYYINIQSLTIVYSLSRHDVINVSWRHYNQFYIVVKMSKPEKIQTLRSNYYMKLTYHSITQTRDQRVLVIISKRKTEPANVSKTNNFKFEQSNVD